MSQQQQHYLRITALGDGGGGGGNISSSDSPVVLGRCRLLQVCDPKVSRKQAVLEFDEATAKWSLTAIDQKTCLYSAVGRDSAAAASSSWRKLNPSESVQLNDGDAFSFLDEKVAAFTVSYNGRPPEDVPAAAGRGRPLPAWMNYGESEREEVRVRGPTDDVTQKVSCDRKNPDQHREELSHPGDDDDDKPECDYGTSCYRRNPQHRLDFRHTRRRPQRKACRRSRQGANIDEDNDASSDYSGDITSDEEDEWRPDSR